MSLTVPAVSISIALTGTTWAGSNWVTIAPFCRTMGMKRGRQHELQRTEAGQLTLDLFNGDGRFNTWSTNSPYYNQLAPTTSNPTTGSGSHSLTNCDQARTLTTSPTVGPRYGPYAWQLTASSAGNMAVKTATTDCTAGRTYQAMAFVKGSTTRRNCTVGIRWKNATGDVISTSTGGEVLDDLASWDAMLLCRAAAPSDAVTKEVVVTVLSASTAEVHYLACLKISDVTSTTGMAAVTPGWCVGQQKPLWPGQPIRVVATWTGQSYPVFAGTIESWVPKYGTILATDVVTAYDYLHNIALMPCPSAVYPALVRESDPLIYWRLNTPLGATVVATNLGHGYTGLMSGPSVKFHTADLFFATAAARTASIATATARSAGIRYRPTSGVTTHGTTEITTEAQKVTTVTLEALIRVDAGVTARTTRVHLFSWGGFGVNLYRGPSGTFSLTPSSQTDTTEVPATFGHILHVAITRQEDGTTTLYVDGTAHSVDSSAALATDEVRIGGHTSGPSSPGNWEVQVQEFAVYDSVLGTTTIQDHYAAVTTPIPTAKSGQQISLLMLAAGVPPAAIGTIDTGTITVKAPDVTPGTTQLLPTLQTTSNTEQGMLYCKVTGALTFASAATILEQQEGTPVCVFADDGASTHLPVLSGSVVPAYDDLTLWNYIAVGIEAATATTPTEAIFYSRTAASEARFGTRELTGYTGMYFADGSDAQALATTLRKRYSTPIERVRSVAVDSAANTGGNLPYILGLDLLTPVKVIWQPGTASPFSQKSQIEMITHVVTKDKWTTTYMLTAVLVP